MTTIHDFMATMNGGTPTWTRSMITNQGMMGGLHNADQSSRWAPFDFSIVPS